MRSPTTKPIQKIPASAIRLAASRTSDEPASSTASDPAPAPEAPRPANPFASMVIGDVAGQSPTDTASARRREVIELFLISVRASDMAKAVNPANIHFMLDQKYDKIVKGDTFDGDVLYPLLSNVRGVTHDMAAGVLLAFKSREERLRLTVKLPRDVEALPLGAKMRLVAAVLEREKRDDDRLVANSVMRKAEVAADRGDMAIRGAGDASPGGVLAAELTARRRKKRFAIAQRAAVVLLSVAAITVNLVFYFWNEVTPFSVDDVANILKLRSGTLKGGEHLLAAVVLPLPYRELMPRKMEQLCAAVKKRGIGAVDLFEGDLPNRKMVAGCFFPPGIDVPRVWVSPDLNPMPLDEVKKLPPTDPLREKLLPKEKPRAVGIFPEATPPPPPPGTGPANAIPAPVPRPNPHR